MNIKNVKKQNLSTIVDGVNEIKEGELLIVTLQNDKKLYVPKNEANTDYQNILSWVAEGNTIEEADD
tara:strand:+ start:371 stop:571 length:201 start_codon:yes stop_codon:yes gene_type:complete